MDSGWVAPRLTDGLCNRLFQVATAAYYAKQWNKKLVFYVPRVQPSVHSDCSVIFKLFPNIPIVWTAESHATVCEDSQDFLRFVPLQKPTAEKIVIQGYFQSGHTILPDFSFDWKNALGAELYETLTLGAETEPERVWWIHVRMGDYQHLPHHQITNPEYWKKAIERIPSRATVMVFSDDLPAAQKLLQICAPPHLKLLLAPADLDALSTLYLMSQCGGGCIGSNSTFSWWAQHMSLARRRGAPCILPRPWHKHVPISKTDPYRDWHTVIDC
jgi:hypothetical protein